MASRSLQIRRSIALFPRQQHLQTTAWTLGQTKINFGPRLSDEVVFKMASLMGPSARCARGKLSRLFPSFLHMKGYCHAAAMENYLYHPKSRPLEPEVQTLNLTKTLHMGDISSCLQDTIIDAATRESMMPKFRQNIIQTRLINFDGEIATRDKCALPLMQNMLRVVWSSTNR